MISVRSLTCYPWYSNEKDSSAEGRQVNPVLTQRECSSLLLRLKLLWGCMFVFEGCRWEKDPLKKIWIMDKPATKIKVSCQQQADSKSRIAGGALHATGYWESIFLIQQEDLLLVLLRSQHITFISLSLHLLHFASSPRMVLYIKHPNPASKCRNSWQCWE